MAKPARPGVGSRPGPAGPISPQPPSPTCTTALQHTRLRLGEGHAGVAALERRIVSIPDLTEAETGFQRSPRLPDEGFVAYYAAPLIAKGQVQGVLEIWHRAPLNPDPEWLEFLQTLARQAAIAVDNAALFNDLQRSNVRLSLAYDATIEGWARALELRDMETEGHSQRVTEMAVELGRALGMSEAELVHVRRGALLHDIGKMGV
ncbi:MAG: GAF domain-containing protein, partial [Chloroflexi bacterium]|nr:GAF domain-containing protein [Chloroflexota bacterium]